MRKIIGRLPKRLIVGAIAVYLLVSLMIFVVWFLLSIEDIGGLKYLLGK